ncbi:GNAT family N-acetyltransferase [Vulcanisaeta distributa]|uniref:GCN5-related N-acetyltransferase n=1 Tax=Vulcanisaeta distributa (strain DSM 14429 / JCM 11212 / NBRC 100878 / IC-017) TaxID=572478 RepID=E1QNH9_VULDI|nr:GNAT family N-acetyltransferase [Vulcanisaeta distributa]ADN51267.1 GCN5-related N-acetyltransferase [Vulcanisaeta distributa DSM 14429]
MIVDVFRELNRDVLSLIKRAYLADPVRYAYLYYDITYYPEFTEAYLNVVGNDIVGYLLIFRGLPYTAIHIIGNAPLNALNETLLNNHLVIHAETEPKHVNYLVNKLSSSGVVSLSRGLTMICWGNHFKEFVIRGNVTIRRLSINDIDEFLKIKNIQGSRISKAEALIRLSSPHWHYYGLFTNNELVAIAGTYLKLPEVWAIGDVFTAPNYRNRGFAKAVVSAITRDAINANAIAMLHVDEGNTPAIKVYGQLGYIAVQYFTWLRFEHNS